jgi:hypothetical protein
MFIALAVVCIAALTNIFNRYTLSVVPHVCALLTLPLFLFQRWSFRVPKPTYFVDQIQIAPESVANVGVEIPAEQNDVFFPAEPVVEGYAVGPNCRFVRSSGGLPAVFDNEYASGKVYIMHKPAPGDTSGDAAYFSGRKRVWETRMQVSPRVAPTSSLLFGLELSNYVPVSSATRSLQAWVIRLLQRAVGNDLYHSPGDDPAKTVGAQEKPVFAMPLWAFDHVIVSEPGEEPDITGNLDGLGQLRSTGRREFVRTMSDFRIVPGKVYTFSFYCISRYLDVCRWEMTGILPGRRFSFNTFCGSAPVNLVLYELQDAIDPAEKRHLEERKRVFVRTPFWSSTCRPAVDKVRHDLGTDGLKAWLGDDFEKYQQATPEIPQPRPKTLLSRIASATCQICGNV